jgi:hypothetical protein
MATITISLNGSAITGLTTNPSKSYTVSDADLQAVLNWAQVAFAGALPQPPATPTNPQILLAWIQNWVNGTKSAVQQFNTPAPVAPAAPTIA